MEATYISGSIAAGVSLLALLGLKSFARKVRLVDLPNERKSHKGAVPLIGGLSAFAGLLIAWLTSMPMANGFGIYLWCSLLLVILGAIDDAKDIPARFRLVAQIVLGLALSLGSGVYLTSFGNLLGFGSISLGWLGLVVTVAAVIGATNAYNMMDGIDGLAGSMSLVTLLSLAYLFSLSGGHSTEVVLAITISMALIPYMAANLRVYPFRRKVFMGDAGSMFIGFSVVWLLVNGVQEQNLAFRPVTALWLCAVPLMDMVAIMLRRARKGQSVMMPDRDHLHHIFLRAGFTDRQALLIITFLAICLAGVGFAGEVYQVPEVIMFSLFLGVFLAYNWSMSHVWRLLVLFRRFGSKVRPG